MVVVMVLVVVVLILTAFASPLRCSASTVKQKVADKPFAVPQER